MTVADLIEQLKQCDPEARVIVRCPPSEVGYTFADFVSSGTAVHGRDEYADRCWRIDGQGSDPIVAVWLE